MKKIFGGLFARILLIAFSVFIQLALWGAAVVLAGNYDNILLFLLEVFSVACLLYVLIKNSSPEGKIPWIIVILLFPFIGGLLYFSFSGYRMSAKKKRLYERIDRRMKVALQDIKGNQPPLLQDDARIKRQSDYMTKVANCPAYQNTAVTYFPLGEDKWQAMLQELEQAEKFIFMEYFIVQHGLMWDRIEEILARKAAAGVDVRMMYDDLGCIVTLPADFADKLRKKGIACHAVNPFRTLFNANFNNRDHRKICVIDGNVGFTGGVNLADEYINHKVCFGHWKDTAVMLKGEAVYNLTVMFLSMWSAELEQEDTFSNYAPTLTAPTDGVVQPYGDTPLDRDEVGQTVYLNMLNNAKDYVYITTPYLIISREMIHALTDAAKVGVDVRMMLPGIPDKKLIYFLSRSYYKELLEAGVKIYEYAPGFVHAKMFVSDDETATVGTINLDYRSLALHYECGAWFYRSSVVEAVKEDFLATQAQCREITLQNVDNLAKFHLLRFPLLGILRTFAPLL